MEDEPVKPPVPNITPEWLYEAYQQQQQTNIQLQQSNAQLQQSNAEILQMLQNQLLRPHGPTEPVPPPIAPSVVPPVIPPAARPKHSLPKPSYTHDDPSLYPQFRGLLEQKLKVDALACGDTEHDRVWYGFACLEGTASARIFPWINHAGEAGKPLTVDGFFNQLDTAFSDPQKAQKAIVKINLLRQGKRPFREFLQDFETTLLEAGGWGWDDAVRKGYLKVGINFKLKSELVAQPEPASYTQYVDLLRMTSDNIEALNGSSSAPRHQRSTNDPESMDWQPTNATQPAGRGSFVSKEVQERRLQANQCLKCGASGHYARVCRKGWTLPQQQKVAAIVLQEDEQSATGSGKE